MTLIMQRDKTREGDEYMPDGLDETRLQNCLDKIHDGDNEALRELYDLCAPHIYRFALSIVKYRYLAEEVSQETFVGIMIACRSRRIRKPKRYLFTTVKNCAVKALREEHFGEKDDISLYENSLAYRDGSEMTDTPLEELGALRGLDDDERQLVLLCKTEAMTLAQAADVIGLTRTRAKSKYDYAIKKIKKYYEEKGELL